MPELPEVQTVLDTLHAQMGHARIRDVQVRWARIIHGDPQAFTFAGLRTAHRRLCADRQVPLL
ncbi:MAG: DNA-formamidopyrimidine glycosylase family protein [Merdibacter sp.]